MRIYIASCWANRARVDWLKGWLEKQGHRVMSTWHERDYPAAEVVPLQWWAAIDLGEVEQAEAVLSFTDYIDDSCMGAMDFEAGYGYARGKRLFWIGKDARNIFLARYGERWPVTVPAFREDMAA